ncbi:sulfatase [Tichowtungia aerotolerans]|uniref:Sulfatase-like hydrolase/transferase n=1 Tax=Tichowtungia aerotolerans TaxID=2697043 RepID=A0A6P1MA01_9BACT|nr:sulfatase [Tichowtungia aerotolerans]QHI68918.1 sulfatase-like hydrolase/transferase [Tichowtungia aerotolerans]
MQTKYRVTYFIGAVVGVTLALQGVSFAEEKPTKRPNIIHILIDDLGFADVGCYGNDFCETPNIDRFAEQGVRFTDAYSASPICSPSRAAFLTGKTPARLHFEFVTRDEDLSFDWNEEWDKQWADFKLVPPPFTINLPLEEETIAEALKSAGYKTGMTGKWHVAGHHLHYNGWNLTHGPKQQGFDWAVDTFGSHPWGQKKADRMKFKPFEKGVFAEDELTQQAIQFLNQNKDGSDPFFLFVSHYYVHSPLGTQCKWLVDKYTEKAKALGRNYSNERILYAAFVETMDHYVGWLLAAIDEYGLTDNTLVVLTSDNGGMPVWAFNAPLRGSKWNLYEGGVREPTMIRWPGVARPGAVCHVPIIYTDFMPTYCEVAGTTPVNPDKLDGMSIVSILKGDPMPVLKKRPLYWHFPYYHWRGKYENCPEEIGLNDGYVSQTKPQSSIRDGDYKLLYFYEDRRCELYNLTDDPSEQKDVSASMPQKTKQLQQTLFEYFNSVEARLPREHPANAQ